MFQEKLTVLCLFQVSEVGKRLDPQVTIYASLIILQHILLHEHHLRVLVFAYVQHLRWQILSDVKIEELLTQVKLFAAVFDTLRVFIDLEQEEHIVLVNFVVVFLDQVVDVFLNFSHFFSR